MYKFTTKSNFAIGALHGCFITLDCSRLSLFFGDLMPLGIYYVAFSANATEQPPEVPTNAQVTVLGSGTVQLPRVVVVVTMKV